MLCRAKRQAFASYFRSYGLIGGKEFFVDPLRRFVEYIDFDPGCYDYNRDDFEALVKKTWTKNYLKIKKKRNKIVTRNNAA